MSGPGNTNAIVLNTIRQTLSEYFLGFEYDDGRTDMVHLDEAARKVLDSIGWALMTGAKQKGRLGVTVMTESASIRTGNDGLPGIAPKTL